MKKERGLNLELGGLSHSARYLVGVSGGRDSVALLHALVEAGFRRLVVCHLNHGLRGRAAAADARFAAALAAKLGLERAIEKTDVAREAAAQGISIETAARAARYAFFARTARRFRCRGVFLAHHADDQAETLLFNLCRGAGRPGLGGMSRESERTVGGVRLRLLRPMLGVWRDEIDAYIAERGLRFREDASNTDRAFTRNRVRHDLWPELERTFGRDVKKTLWRTAVILRDEEAWLAGLSGESETEARLVVPGLTAQPVAQQRRRILAWLRRHGIPDCGFGQVEAVRAMLEPGGPAKINLPGGRHARRREKRLFLESPKKPHAKAQREERGKPGSQEKQKGMKRR